MQKEGKGIRKNTRDRNCKRQTGESKTVLRCPVRQEWCSHKVWGKSFLCSAGLSSCNGNRIRRRCRWSHRWRHRIGRAGKAIRACSITQTASYEHWIWRVTDTNPCQTGQDRESWRIWNPLWLPQKTCLWRTGQDESGFCSNSCHYHRLWWWYSQLYHHIIKRSETGTQSPW